VRSGKSRDSGWVRPGRLRQYKPFGWLPHVGDECVETGRAKDQQSAALAELGHSETVRHASGEKHQHARTGVPQPLATESLELTLENEEGLVGIPMDMWWRRKTRGTAVVQDSEAPAGVLSADLGQRQGVEEPERQTVVGRQN
jgi:hypothetical protein